MNNINLIDKNKFFEILSDNNVKIFNNYMVCLNDFVSNVVKSKNPQLYISKLSNCNKILIDDDYYITIDSCVGILKKTNFRYCKDVYNEIQINNEPNIINIINGINGFIGSSNIVDINKQLEIRKLELQYCLSDDYKRKLQYYLSDDYKRILDNDIQIKKLENDFQIKKLELEVQREKNKCLAMEKGYVL
jgi:hypothetical protein